MGEHRIGLIIPSINRLTEPQFQRHAPAGVGVHVTRLRMTGKWHKPIALLKKDIQRAAEALSDVSPDIMVFHCTASSMEAGVKGETEVLQWISQASGCPAITTGQAVAQALLNLGIHKLVMISPYVEKTNLIELAYMREAGFEVVHEFGLGLPGGDSYTQVTPKEWRDLTRAHQHPDAEGYFLSCTNTRMIEMIEASEGDLDRPVVTSNQATLWACLTRLGLCQELPGLGQLFHNRRKKSA